MAFDNDTFGNAINGNCSGVVFRISRDHVFGLVHVRQDCFGWLARASGEPGQCHRSGHQSQKAAAARVRDGDALFIKLLFLRYGRAVILREAAPLTMQRPARSQRLEWDEALFGKVAHRWQISQLVSSPELLM